MKNIVRIKTRHPEKSLINRAAAIIHKGGLVVFPTETVYGLGANALCPGAVKKIFKMKGRPSDNPLIVHVARMEDIKIVARNISRQARVLMKAFWPGPLTLILPRKKILSDIVTAGLKTVAVRMPKHKIALALIKAANFPIAAPSANLSGKPSPTSARHVFDDFGEKIDMIIDGGNTVIGLESTVVDTTTANVVVLRAGAITTEMLQKVLGYKPKHARASGKKLKSPGMKYRHYAPKAPLKVCDLEGPPMVRFLRNEILKLQKNGLRVGVLGCSEHKKNYQRADYVIVCGSHNNLHDIARNIYSCLRAFDCKDVDIILAENFGKKGLGQAIMDRLRRAEKS